MKPGMKKNLVRASFGLNILLLVVIVGAWLMIPSLVSSFLADEYERKFSFFENYPVTQQDIVLLGDSITAGGLWNEVLSNRPTRNRGIGGDTTTGVLERLHQVTAGKPAAVFILIGTNDLTHGPKERKTSYEQYADIVKQIRTESPDTRIFLQSVLPRGPEYRLEVEAYNAEIRRQADDSGATYIDLYPAFLQQDGSMDDRYSNDELHLNGPGYALWQNLLQTHLDAL
jgi:lysophospholipase L1-like esterase